MRVRICSDFIARMRKVEQVHFQWGNWVVLLREEDFLRIFFGLEGYFTANETAETKAARVGREDHQEIDFSIKKINFGAVNPEIHQRSSVTWVTFQDEESKATDFGQRKGFNEQTLPLLQHDELPLHLWRQRKTLVRTVKDQTGHWTISWEEAEQGKFG